MKLLKEKYKTFEGARKRAAFENGLAPGEFKRGDKARLYRYNIIQEGDHWRVARIVPARVPELPQLLRIMTQRSGGGTIS